MDALLCGLPVIAFNGSTGTCTRTGARIIDSLGDMAKIEGLATTVADCYDDYVTVAQALTSMLVMADGKRAIEDYSQRLEQNLHKSHLFDVQAWADSVGRAVYQIIQKGDK
jgi:predicted O-linked N-acetylglucosamine transferase (SPINDLY family)